MMIRIVPKIFYDRLSDGLNFFSECMGFEIMYRDKQLAVVSRDGTKAYIEESPEYAAKDRPEITIETDDIEEIYAEISAKHPEILHPNLPRPTNRPWGSVEFSLLDKTGVCVVFRQWAG